MSSFRVDLDEPPKGKFDEPLFGASNAPKRRSRRPFFVAAGALVGLMLIVFVGGFLYWQNLKGTPQYSLALLVDAAKRDDKPAIAENIDIDAVVDDFVPQITGKAVELYGRGIPQGIVEKLTRVALPILPAVKERAKAELPRVIRERTEQFGNVPFVAMVVGAPRYLDITVSGNNAVVKSKLPEHVFEVKMKRVGNRWQIVGVKDDNLATEIARKVGQEMIAMAMKGFNNAGEKLGVGNIADLLRQAEELVK